MNGCEVLARYGLAGLEASLAGVVADPSKPSAEKKLLPVTALGRYMKVLLSSNEFLFMN